jgi:hypothetical protein
MCVRTVALICHKVFSLCCGQSAASSSSSVSAASTSVSPRACARILMSASGLISARETCLTAVHSLAVQVAYSI